MPPIFANRYDIAGLLGQGGFGVVYRARDLHLDREVALKTFQPGQPLDVAVYEAQRLTALEGPHILRVFNADRYQDISYVATEIAPLGSTMDYMGVRGLRPDLAIRWARHLLIVTQQVDGLSHVTRYQYDALNHKTAMTYAYGDPLAKTTTYSFDKAGNLLTVGDAFATSRITTYSYDEAGQATRIAYSDGTTPNATFTFDGLGRRTATADGTGTTTYVYDSLGRLTSQTDGAGKTLGFGYDLKGQLTSIIYPDAVGTVTRGYDDVGRLKTILDWLSPGTRTPFTYAYDANSNVINLAYPNGDAAAMTFDRADRMTQKTDTAGGVTILNLGYAPDNIGLNTAEGTKVYSYDHLNRVTTASDNSGTSYAYDNADRMTQVALTGGNTSTLAYDNSDQLSTMTTKNNANVQISQYTYLYDNNGNRTRRTDQLASQVNYGFDQANRLVSLTGQHAGTYSYNGDGLRMAKVIDGVTTSDTWMAAGSLPVIVREGIGVTATNYVTGLSGLPIVRIGLDGTAFYYHMNKLGSVAALTTATGSVANTYNYDPYGNRSSAVDTVADPFQYGGQYFDPETGLYYLRARYYDPSTAQFLSRDPAVAMTREPYAYVNDNPLNATDSSGLFGWDDVVNFGKGVVTAPFADAHSVILNVESVISPAFYVPYWGAYQVNSHWSGEPAPVRHFMSSVQRVGLNADEVFDRFQQCSGYPGASANDEEQKVSPIPSVIYPTWDKDQWKQNKWSQPWWTTQGPGTDPSGKEHFAD